MKICLINGNRLAREVLTKALVGRLGADVTAFPCCENALAGSLDYDVFVVYNNFNKRMTGMKGVTNIRARKADAYILGVSSTPNFDKKFIPAGANAFLLRSGNEVEELIELLHGESGPRVVGTAYLGAV